MCTEDAPRLAPDGVFPLVERLRSPDLRWGSPQGYSFGTLQPLLDEHAKAPTRILVGGDPMQALAKMLDAGRLDWFPYALMPTSRLLLPQDRP
ncbi:hypothetical protein [Desulfocurvus sp. DL9XJH121]